MADHGSILLTAQRTESKNKNLIMLNHEKQAFVSTWFTAHTKSLRFKCIIANLCDSPRGIHLHINQSFIFWPHKVWKGTKWPSLNNKFDNCQLVYSVR